MRGNNPQCPTGSASLPGRGSVGRNRSFFHKSPMPPPAWRSGVILTFLCQFLHFGAHSAQNWHVVEKKTIAAEHWLSKSWGPFCIACPALKLWDTTARPPPASAAHAMQAVRGTEADAFSQITNDISTFPCTQMKCIFHKTRLVT